MTASNTPKPERAWAVYGSLGLFYPTVGPTRRDAIANFMKDEPRGSVWAKTKRKCGLTVLRITITPEGGG